MIENCSQFVTSKSWQKKLVLDPLKISRLIEVLFNYKVNENRVEFIQSLQKTGAIPAFLNH